MSDKFQDRYRIPSARWQSWDYGWNAPYFVTICTHNRECYFGDILVMQRRDAINRVSTVPTHTMVLSEIGKIATQLWCEIPKHFPFVVLGEFVVMPNHVHGIIFIDKTDDDRCDDDRRGGRDAINRVSTITSKTGGFAGNKNPMTNDNLSRIVRWYKGRVSFESRKIRADFEWQSRFYDHIIRNNESYQQISDYIQNNPLNWPGDKFYRD